MTYSEKLKDPRWQKKRLEVLSRDKFTCTSCGDSGSQLHVHHLKYTKPFPWEEPSENLNTVCLHCHALFTKYESDDFKIIKLEKSFRRNGDVIYFCLQKYKDEHTVYMVKVSPNGDDIELIAMFTKMDVTVLSELINFQNEQN